MIKMYILFYLFLKLTSVYFHSIYNINSSLYDSL
nr:MAG TPA: hypothetical protein [Ackermannviridae sp.]